MPTFKNDPAWRTFSDTKTLLWYAILGFVVGRYLTDEVIRVVTVVIGLQLLFACVDCIRHRRLNRLAMCSFLMLLLALWFTTNSVNYILAASEPTLIPQYLTAFWKTLF